MPNFAPFDVRKATDELRIMGATVLPRAFTARRESLLQELAPLARTRAKTDIGPHRVVQNYDFTSDERAGSILGEIGAECAAWLDEGFATMKDRPLKRRLDYARGDIHWYPRTPIGVGYHRDGAKYKSLATIVFLAGDGDFKIASERSGLNSVRLIQRPGDVILLRMNGFDGYDVPLPFHGVFDIMRERTTLGFRSLC